MANLTRRNLLLTGSLVTIGLLGLSGCDGGTGNDENNPFRFIAAFHCAAGISEPTEYGNGSQAEIDTATANLMANESSSDTKTIFVAAEIVPDEKRNLEVGSVSKLSTGEMYCNAELVIDGTNEYRDEYDINDRDWKSTYLDSGFHDGGNFQTVLAASEQTYKVVFAFSIGNNDCENGEKASLLWGDYSLDFDIDDIQEAGTPNEILSKLQSLS